MEEYEKLLVRKIEAKQQNIKDQGSLILKKFEVSPAVSTT